MDVNRPSYVILFTAAIAAVFTAAVMTVHVLAADTIRRNERLREQRALVTVFGLGDVATMPPGEIEALVRRRIRRGGEPVRDPVSGASFELIRLLRADGGLGPLGEVAAVAFPIRGNGLWAPIYGFMALEADLRTVRGVVFTEHKETPGLGGRITERTFQDQFRGLALPESDDAEVLLSVDAITGATQTSMRVERFLNQNLRQFRRAFRHSLKGVPVEELPTEAPANTTTLLLGEAGRALFGLRTQNRRSRGPE